jgi:hypothetical protein
MLEAINPNLSRKVLEILVEDGLSIPQIAKEAGTTAAYLKRVQAGETTLLPRHLDKLDDVHPDLPFRLGARIVKEEVMGLAGKGKSAAKKLRSRGEGVVDSAARTLRKGAWKLLNGVL